MKYYIYRNFDELFGSDKTIVCVVRNPKFVRDKVVNSFSYHYEDEEESHTFAGSPTFIRTGLDKNWQQIWYNELPEWAKKKIERGGYGGENWKKKNCDKEANHD